MSARGGNAKTLRQFDLYVRVKFLDKNFISKQFKLILQGEDVMDECELGDLESLENHLGPSIETYPLNCWWVAATADEVCEKPLARTMLQKRVALFRTNDGKPYAFMDRCAHRWAPISRGKIVQDEIVISRNEILFGYLLETILIDFLISLDVPNKPDILLFLLYIVILIFAKKIFDYHHTYNRRSEITI